MAEIQVEGLGPLLAALDAMPEIATPELERAGHEAALLVISDLADYPDPPPTSHYRRTGTLGREWTGARPEFRASSGAFEVKAANNTPYGPFVQDADEQAPIHQQRWPTTAQALDQNEDAINARFAAAAERIADKVEQKA